MRELPPAHEVPERTDSALIAPTRFHDLLACTRGASSTAKIHVSLSHDDLYATWTIYAFILVHLGPQVFEKSPRLCYPWFVLWSSVHLCSHHLAVLSLAAHLQGRELVSTRTSITSIVWELTEPTIRAPQFIVEWTRDVGENLDAISIIWSRISSTVCRRETVGRSVPWNIV